MVSPRHGKQTVAQGIHGIVAYEYPNAAARLAAGPFTLEDLYKVAVQLDNNSLWVLTDTSPIIWTVSSATGGTQDLASVLSIGNDADGYKIINLLDPTNPQDAATKNYVDTNSGGGSQTLKQTLALGNVTDGYDVVISSGDVITITDAPVNPTDGVNKSYVDGYFTSTGLFIRVDGTSTVSANITFNNHKLTDVTDPTLPQDVATKNYVDGYDFSGAVTLSGDVTGSAGSNTIANSAVTYAKIQNVSTASKLLGRGSSGSGVLQEINLGTNLIMSGTTLNATGGGGASQNLFITLSLGNSTDGYDIIVSTGDVITIIDAPVNPTDAVNKGYVDGYVADNTILIGSIAGGDLTGTYPNPTVGTNKITFAKFQQITTDRLLGRDTAATGDVEQISVTGGLEFTGSGGIQTSAFTGDVTKTAGGTTLTIANNAVIDAKFRQSAALSIVGNASNSTANIADISGSASSDAVLRISGTSLGFGTVATAGITNSAVTFAKIQDVATDSLLGRDTASSGVIENILLNATLEMDGSGNLRRAALTGDVTATAGSNATTIANNVVSDAKLRTSVALSVIGRSANSTGNVADISGSASSDAVLRISGTTLGFGTIATAGITDAAITYAKIQNVAALSIFGRAANSSGVGADITGTASSDAVLRVSGTSLGFGTVATAGIANSAITFAKIQNIATDSLLGRDTGSSGVVENILLNVTLSMDGSGNLQRAALTGDVTASAGSNATTIAANAVTFAKVQQITTDRLLGRDTAATGNVEEISVTGGLEFSGSTAIQRSALTGDVTASAGSNTTTVIKINGTTITTAGGALTTGQSLRVTGVATSDWGAIDLSNTNAITGILPTANQAGQTWNKVLTAGATTSGVNPTISTGDFEIVDGYIRFKVQSFPAAVSSYGILGYSPATVDGYQIDRLSTLLNDGYLVKDAVLCDAAYQFQANTTNATPIQIFTLAVDDNASWLLNYEIFGIAGTANKLKRVGSIPFGRINAGSVLLESAHADASYYRTNTAWDASFSGVGNNLKLTVTGQAATNIAWKCKFWLSK